MNTVPLFGTAAHGANRTVPMSPVVDSLCMVSEEAASG